MLRRVLAVDAVASGVMGVALLVGAEVLPGLLGVPESLPTPTGWFLLGYAAALGVMVAWRRPVPLPVWAVVMLNLTWVVLSVAVTFLWPLTSWGAALVWLQAVLVVGFAWLEFLGLKPQARTAQLT